MSLQPITVTFTLLTDPVNLFVNLDAANTFFSSFSVPVATTTTTGVVQTATLPANLTLSTVVNTDTFIITDANGNNVTYSVPDISSFTQLLAQVNALQTAFNALQAAMRTAGSGQ